MNIDIKGVHVEVTDKIREYIDKKLHPDFAAVAGEIDKKLAALEEIAAAQPPDAQTED